MALLQRVKSPEWAAGDTLTAADLVAEFNNIINGLNGSNDIEVDSANITASLSVTGNAVIGTANANIHTITGQVNISNTVTVTTNVNAGNINAATTLIAANVDIIKALPPIGSIIPFFDFSDALTWDSTYWKICNGQSATIGGSSRTTPDLSGRYLVGFGTDGGGDNNGGVLNAVATGNAGHTIDISHTHTTNIAAFSSATANVESTAAGGSHDHGGRTDGMEEDAANESSFDYRIRDDGLGWVNRVAGSRHIVVDSGSTDEGQHDHQIASDGSHTHTLTHIHEIDPPITTSGSSLSSTQSIQPRSIRVRYIMRAK